MRTALLCTSALLVAACGEAHVEVTEAARVEEEPVDERPPGQPIELKDGLVCEVTRAGSGAVVAANSRVKLHYDAYLADGWPAGPEGEEPRSFDSSASRHVPLELDLGSHSRRKVIAGLERGLVGLRAGSEAVLHVPAGLAWGESGHPPSGVPENAAVVYEVRILEVE
jgi:peptidylprolyl isomerase